MRAARGLAVNGDDVRCAVAQRLDPGDEAGLEQRGIEGINHVVQGVVGGNAALIGQEAAQKVQALLAPQLDLDEILHAAQRRAQHQEHDLRQRVDHPPLLTRIAQRRKMVEKRDRPSGSVGHGRLRTKRSLS